LQVRSHGPWLRANVPVEIAMALIVKGYLVYVNIVPEDAVLRTFTA
jgi:hypothetical protein